jgi:hypothetical protein
MKQLRELFARNSSRWLAIELILVTCACMWAFDPVIVTAYVTHQPMGYDPDQLVRMEVGCTKTMAEWFNNGNYQDVSEQELLLEKIRAMDDVQQAYPANGGTIGFDASVGNGFFYNGGDSLLADKYYFLPESKMFEVFGIQSLTPGVPTEELTKDCEWDKSIILSRTAAMTLFGTTDVAGRTIRGEENLYNQDTGDFDSKIHDFRIRAVVEDVRTNVFDRDHDNVYLCKYSGPWNFYTIVRLRPGVDARRFMSGRKREVEHDLVTEHLYVRRMESGSEALDRQVESNWQGRQSRRNLLIATFFGVNLAFGVFGTLLMYTRQRREEAGVRRAFGATKWSVFLGFIREAWLLTTISVLLGCAVYFQIAASKGLCDDFTGHNPTIHLWFDDFGTHFLVVSVIVYLIILCAVLVATAIPAWRICRIEITEALKD